MFLNLTLKQQKWMPCTLTLPFMLLHRLLLKYCKCLNEGEKYSMCVFYVFLYVFFHLLCIICLVSCYLVFIFFLKKLKVWFVTTCFFYVLHFSYHMCMLVCHLKSQLFQITTCIVYSLTPIPLHGSLFFPSKVEAIKLQKKILKFEFCAFSSHWHIELTT